MDIISLAAGLAALALSHSAPQYVIVHRHVHVHHRHVTHQHREPAPSGITISKN
jgi:hypothetical protein